MVKPLKIIIRLKTTCKKILQKIFQMQIDIDKINKLPPDVRDRFKKLLFKYKEENKKELARDDFLEFTKQMWPDFIEGELTIKQLRINLIILATGKIKRLIVNMPPRHTKSEFASTLLPAWMIGTESKIKNHTDYSHRRTCS
jgi:hypothetical protein